MATALLKDPASPSSDEREIEKEEEGSGKVASSVDSGKVKVHADGCRTTTKYKLHSTTAFSVTGVHGKALQYHLKQ